MNPDPMNPDPFTDIARFTTEPGWPAAAFWLLLILSLVIANYVLVTIPWQRRFGHLGQWLARLLVGAMLWQQSLAQLPPSYTDQPEQPFGETGLAYWLTLMGRHAAFSLQADFINQFVLPNFDLFAPIIFGLKVLTAVSLMLGALVRLFAAVGAVEALYLWLALYGVPGEWPWSYLILSLLMLMLAVHQSGRSLGIDAILATRLPARLTTGAGRRLFDALT